MKLGIDEVITIMDSWYAQHKQDPIEKAGAVKNILQELMDVNELESAADSAFWLEFGHETYQMSLSLSARSANIPELLRPSPGLDSLVTPSEDKLLDTPTSFSRAPSDGRPTGPLYLEIWGKRSLTIRKTEVQR